MKNFSKALLQWFDRSWKFFIALATISSVVQIFFGNDPGFSKLVFIFLTIGFICILVFSVGTQFRKRTIPDSLSWIHDLDIHVQPANETDVHRICALAKRHYSCPINDVDLKLPWWRKNPHIFHVIKDKDNNVLANINILPLKLPVYERLKAGNIIESEITADDIYPNVDRTCVSHLYVEGFLARSSRGRDFDSLSILIFLLSYRSIFSSLAHPDNIVEIGAIGGTREGERLLRRLSFVEVTSPRDRRDKIPFFSVSFEDFSSMAERRANLNLILSLHDRRLRTLRSRVEQGCGTNALTRADHI
ncbi:MAG: hypothetical protein PVH61_23635 [Candidatus Aminicenantes bacterium]|jgi:hypothetical protein